MNKPSKDKLVTWLCEMVILCLWFWFLSWITGDVPRPWHTPLVFALFYLSQVAAHLGRLTNAAIAVLKEI